MAIIKPTLHHVTIKTSRLAEMVTWYGNLVGATVQFIDANNAWMTNDSANHRIAFLSVPKLEDDPDKGKHNGSTTAPSNTVVSRTSWLHTNAWQART